MAILNSVQRREVWAEVMRYWSNNRNSIESSKPELRAAVDAIDQWVSDNTSSFNSAIPLPARTQLTKQEKAKLLVDVITERFEVDV